ncbi:hypothetical protein NPIL_29281 [Nephila pilipes]|uniref:Uncharacterized protein n=1 Tax=Nephila pilipes TaxID=299642 RepID=A0A8X6ULZ9_NEPPI|nr:hypothetical protein NPIL_29281 [Nephila pilipes]
MEDCSDNIRRECLGATSIGIKPIFHTGLIYRALGIIHKRFLLKPGGRRKRAKDAIVLGFLIGDESFHQPMPDHMFYSIGLVRKVDLQTVDEGEAGKASIVSES